MPGTTDSSGCCCSRGKAACSMLPQVGVGGCTPTPRYDIADSTRIICATSVVPITTAGPITWWRAVDALIVAVAFQIGVNFANDYSDGVRGTDAERRGPLRLTATGLATPGQVRLAAILSLLVGAVAGLVLALVVNPWLIVFGAVLIVLFKLTHK